MQLPRGSAVIHACVVTSISASQIKFAWPGSFFAVATPRLAVPGEPGLSVISGLDRSTMPVTPVAQLNVSSRTGAPIEYVELYRTLKDRLATSVDTMGPPISTSDDLGWVVARNGGGSIISAAYTDASITSGWQRIWYRAVAWSADTLDGGEIGTRSSASPAVAVLVAPNTPPDLSDLQVREAGSTATSILIGWQSTAPILLTPLGPHSITLVVRDPELASGAPPTLRLTTTFDATPRVTAAHRPPADPAGGPIFRQVIMGLPDRFFAWVPRPTRSTSATTPFVVTVQITDPLGRTNQLSSEVTWT